MNPRLTIDGSVYELVPKRTRDSIATCFDINIMESGKRVALFRLRCAAFEPQYEMIERMSMEDLMGLAVQRGGLEGHVRSALHWQSELRKINPEWGISPVFQAWFPENYDRAAQ